MPARWNMLLRVNMLMEQRGYRRWAHFCPNREQLDCAVCRYLVTKYHQRYRIANFSLVCPVTRTRLLAAIHILSQPVTSWCRQRSPTGEVSLSYYLFVPSSCSIYCEKKTPLVAAASFLRVRGMRISFSAFRRQSILIHDQIVDTLTSLSASNSILPTESSSRS